jgi:hypothetical protein
MRMYGGRFIDLCWGRFFYVPCLPVAHTHYNCTLFSLTGVCSGIGCQTFHDLFTMSMHDLLRQQEPDSMN